MNLYNKERPLLFKDVVGQDKVISQLTGLLASDNRPTAFLFIGPRGTGKTTIARIMARSVNCESPNGVEPCNECASCRSILAGANMDVKELDAASNNKVEDIRELIQNTQYAAVGKRKVYILDEVHMLSQGAFNALLKTLEEPPDGCYFILCTTEEHKVPATIQSRCSRFYFERMEMAVITEYLASICDKYNVAYELDGLKLIARAADGCMRDALSILEPGMLNESLSTQMIRENLGLMEEDAVFGILQGIITGNAEEAVKTFHEVCKKGNSVAALLKEIMSACCDIVYVQQSRTTENIINTEQYIRNIKMIAGISSVEDILHIAAGLAEVYSVSSQHGNIGFFVEMEILKLIASESSYKALENRVILLEEKVAAWEANTAVIQKKPPIPCNQQDQYAGNTFDTQGMHSDDTGQVIPAGGDAKSQSDYPDTEDFDDGGLLPGDNSSLVKSDPNNDLTPENNFRPYPQHGTETTVLDDGSKVIGSINIFGTSGQEQNDQPAAASNEDIMSLGMFAGFV